MYHNNVRALAINLLEINLPLNSVTSDSSKDARFMLADIIDLFLATPIKNPEFMKVEHKHVLPDMQKQYNLASLETSDKHVYVRIQKGMPGLKQATLLAYEDLKIL